MCVCVYEREGERVHESGRGTEGKSERERVSVKERKLRETKGRTHTTLKSKQGNPIPTSPTVRIQTGSYYTCL